MKILFSVVSHNQQCLVQKLIDSMATYLITDGHDLIFVVTENVLSEIRLNSDKFNLNFHINLRKNGFGSNHNRVFESHSSDYFFIINPDIELKEKVKLDDIIEKMENKKIHIASPRILNQDDCLEDYKRADLTLKNLIKRKVFRIPDQEFHWFAGMFLIVKSESFRTLNGFDTKFYMYVEDCDLCNRARASKLNINDLNEFSVTHKARRASRKSIKHMVWHVTSLFKYWASKISL